MKNCNVFLVASLLFFIPGVNAQVQVSKEPHHKNVFENNYLRILDVHLEPLDTTLFHIHSTPSVTLMYTTTAIGVQNQGQNWGKGRNISGRASYSSFLNNSLIHRVSNSDTVHFHVNVIEILAPYKTGSKIEPLPSTVLFDNEKVTAYRIIDSLVNDKVFAGRGPIVAGFVEGKPIVFHDMDTKKDTTIKSGDYLYIKPESRFYFSAVEKKTNLVLFEIK